MSELLPGVYTAKTKNNTLYYRASITKNGKHISLGSYSDMTSAHDAYITATTILADTKESLLTYTDESPLPFFKWVVLINYRDNHLYLSSPIYIHTTYFEYYLSPDFILKFDKDDLFYYSHKKIMKRGNHLFVADYGMQVNLLNRYGIKSFSVPGRDFLFLNGDTTDFRYANIEIINRYMGVLRKQTAGKTTYQVKIHVKSSYVVGTYNSETEAAIAYNKAADLLRKQGVQKNFTQNYIEDISAREYADYYSALPISKRIMQFHHFSE